MAKLSLWPTLDPAVSSASSPTGACGCGSEARCSTRALDRIARLWESERWSAESCAELRVEVAGNRIGVDVELDRSNRSGAHECVGKLSRCQVLAGSPHQLPGGGDPKAGSRDRGEILDRYAPTGDHAGRDVCGGHSAVDEQMLVLQDREDALACRGHAVVPGTDVRCPIGVGDDRGESRLQRDGNVSTGRMQMPIVASL